MSDNSLFKCIEGNKHVRDYMKEMVRYGNSAHPEGEEEVVYWCSECGAIVVEIEYDGRSHHPSIPLKYPAMVLDRKIRG